MLCSVLCLVSKVFWPFHFAEYTVTGVVYLDTLDEFLFPIFIEEGANGLLLQQDEVLPNFHVAVRASLDA
jgi:hypothetical protein